MAHNPDPSDPRRADRWRKQDTRAPAGWDPDPLGFTSSMAAPRDDVRKWWRVKPAEAGPDGRPLPRVVHGGNCSTWPAGRHPRRSLFLNRAEVRQVLDDPDAFVPCPTCARGWIAVIWPWPHPTPRPWPPTKP